MAAEDDDEDYDDEDYSPNQYEEEEAGIYPDAEMELSGDEEEDQDRTMVDENDDLDEDEEDNGTILRPRRRAIVAEDSDVEMDENDAPKAIARQESSPSEGRSEEEGDKENEDIVENKENACFTTRPAFQRHGESLHGLEDDFTQNLRMPLGTLEEDTSPLSFMDRLKQDSTGDLQFTPLKFGGESSFSQSSQETLHETPALQPGFDDLFSATTQKAPKLQSLAREDTFTRLFGNVRKNHDDDLGLTQDVALQPAFEAEESLKRKADDIFAKEQEFLLRESVVETRKEPELFVDENGFLTQTRPSASTESQLPVPTPSRPSQFLLPTPSLGTQFLSPYLSRQTQERQPLGTLSFTPSQKPHKSRFVQRSSPFNTGYQSSPSPSPSRKPRLPRPKVRLEKSEFVEGEAEESDEDEMRGFGVVHQTGDDEDLDGEDQDKNLESLVDDVQMDEETIAAEKVLEKVREHAEFDDKELEKLHQAATEGKLRTLKRKKKLGFGDDSDDEDDYEDDNDRRLRAKMAKKDPKGIADLAENPETQPFAAAYRISENDEDLFGVEAEGAEEDDQMDEQEQVSRAEVVREILRTAQDQQDEETVFDPHDVSHVDAEEEDDDQENMVVNVADSKLAAAGASRNRRAVDDDPELEESQFGQRAASNADYLNRMQKWAKDEKRPGRAGASSRSVHSAAITGHKNVKAGAGSVRKGVAKSSESISTGKRPQVKPAPSLLVGPSLDRSKRFA
ncbi:hypothetical protein BDZ89DRAFT_101606 [Hymenopellis radicata]|nr:hypothetical protein BDZ89DRAFT_101606 [Hymenopellis radicata]